jgi:hypothetical protein
MLTAACADAPITAADIQADGQLREQPSSQQSVHAASEQAPRAQRAERLRVTGLLASEADGPLEDANRFSLANDAVYLHLRADDLQEPRPVTFVWTHADAEGEHRRETMGFLQPSETITLAASLPLARYREAAEALAAELAGGETGPETGLEPIARVGGEWKVEVFSSDLSGGRNLLFERDFEVIDAEAYDLLVAEALADAGPAGVSH